MRVKMHKVIKTIFYIKSSSTLVKKRFFNKGVKKKKPVWQQWVTLTLNSYIILNTMIQASRINNSMPFGHRLLYTAGTFQQCGYSVQSPQRQRDFGPSSNPL